jgi:hypothetical protein
MLTFGVVVLGVTDRRLVSLGANRVDWDRFPDDPDFVVLADPEGNRFCIVDLAHDSGHLQPAG